MYTSPLGICELKRETLRSDIIIAFLLKSNSFIEAVWGIGATVQVPHAIARQGLVPG